MSRLKILIAVVFTLCSLFFVGTAGGFVSEAAVLEPIEVWNVSKNPGTDSVTAKLYINKEDNTKFDLVITGEGRMADFSASSPAPWCEEYSDTLLSATIGSEITYIGKYAFFECGVMERLTVLNPQAEFYALSDTVIPPAAAIYGHEVSTAKSYSEYLYPKYFGSICEFNNSKCSVCGYECTAHTGGAASCEESAKCDVCGMYYGEPAGHRYSDWISEISSDCYNDGVLGHYECFGCDKYFNAEYKKLQQININSQGHSYGEWIEGIEADCTNPGGFGHYECSSCGKNFDSSKNEIDFILIGALGHTGGVANCLEPCVCDRCGETYGNKNAENHNFSLFPTYDSENHWYECLCGSKRDSSPHTYTSSVTKEPTATEEGIRVISCACGYEKTEHIDMLQSTENGVASPKPENLSFPVIAAVVITSTVVIVFAAIVIIIKKKR